MSILNVKRWEPWVYEFGNGSAIRMKLRRLKRDEAKAIQKALRVVMLKQDEMKRGGDDLSAAAKAELLDAAFDAVSAEEIVPHIKDVEDFQVEGEPVTSGADFWEWADNNMRLSVLLQLAALSSLSVSEGKAFPSASPSPSTQGPQSSGSPAMSTDSADGRAH